MDIRLCGPKELWPERPLLDRLKQAVSTSNGRFSLEAEVGASLPGADFVYTDVWLSMGEPKERWAERIRLLTPFRVSEEVMATTGNAHAKFMHCLPAFHNRETNVGEEMAGTFGIDCMEVTENVFEGPSSIVFDQAENRMHTIKAVLVATIGS
jgi:ornithine carbamoyltransferase